jgi:serine/threonine protein kinase
MDNNSQTNQNEDEMIGKLIFDRYKLIKRLGAGSFGSIYEAVYQNQYYAIKLEEKNRGQNLLETEAYIMSYLHGPGLPFVKSYGYSSKHNILVMELMGESLEDKFEGFVVKKMSNRCVCNIGYQMIEILEYIHNKHVIHRDIKPDNFVVGRGEKRKYIYILDFGLSKKYRSSRTLKHYQILKSKNLTGTARYASINALNGLTQSRRDDLEAVGYVLMYFLRGRLPWQGIPVKNKEDRYRKIMEKKMATSAEELCMGFPNEFADYINYTRNLQYEQDPDYNYLKNLFLNVLSKSGYRVDCYYDWDKETINYFRDFKNVDNIKNNKNKNDSSSVSTNQQFNMKDVNSFASTENKTYNKINNNIQKYNSNSNNNLSMVNYQGNNKISGFVNSASGSGLYQNRIGHENPNTNELINGLNKDQNKINYIQGNQTSQTQVNNIQNNGIYNNSVNIGNNNNNQENNKNLEQQQLNKDHNYDKNEVKELPKEQKNMNPRADKDNKCCLIF